MSKHKGIRLNIFKDGKTMYSIGSNPDKRIECTVEQFQRAYPKMKGKVNFKVDDVQHRSHWCTPLSQAGIDNVLKTGNMYGHDFTKKET